VGHLVSYLREPLGYIHRVSRDYGPVVPLSFGPLRTWLISDPEDVERVLITDARHYRKDRFLRDLRRVVGNGLLTSEGDFWRRQRRLAQPAFHRQRIRSYGEMMVASAEDTLGSWWPGQIRDLREEMMALTLDVVGKTLFSSRTREIAAQVAHSTEVVMEHFVDPLTLTLPFLADLPLPSSRRFHRAIGELDRLVRGIIAEHRRADAEQGDLLAMLLAARDEDGSAMSEDQLRDEVITLFLAGHETTALSLSWTFWLLGQHPEVDGRLHEELRGALQERPLTVDDLPRLPYAEAVILESMRLYPPAWSIGREAATRLEIRGHEVQEGDQIFICMWAMHRDPRFFPEPERFRPERWLDGLQKRLPRFAYFPFGGGPRLCIGNAFAMMESVLLLAAIARRFRLELLPGQQVTPLPSVTLRPRGTMRARLIARG
jgi:cytochrome P450